MTWLAQFNAWAKATAERIVGRPLETGEHAVSIVAEHNEREAARIRSGPLGPLLDDAGDVGIAVRVAEHDQQARSASAATAARAKSAKHGETKSRIRAEYLALPAKRSRK